MWGEASRLAFGANFMAIALEAFTVVLRAEGLARLGGVEAFQALVPNSTFCYDDELARCAFMDRGDAVEFIQALHIRGLETCLLYTSPSPRDLSTSRMPSSA